MWLLRLIFVPNKRTSHFERATYAISGIGGYFTATHNWDALFFVAATLIAMLSLAALLLVFTGLISEVIAAETAPTND